MDTRLGQGQYFGSVLRQARLGPALISETRHPPHAHLPAHAHKNAYFCFVRRGRYREMIEGSARDCLPLTVAFHPPDEKHSEHIAAAAVLSMNAEVMPAWLAKVHEVVPQLRDPVHCQGGPPAWLGVRLYHELIHPDNVAPLAVEGLLLEISAAIMRSAAPSKTKPTWVSRIRDILCSQYRENLLLSDLAVEAGVHPAHLAMTFRQQEGCSVGEFVRARRVARAAELLMKPGRSLASIAAEAGFSDQSHMTRLFKRATGLTPAVFVPTLAADRSIRLESFKTLLAGAQTMSL